MANFFRNFLNWLRRKRDSASSSIVGRASRVAAKSARSKKSRRKSGNVFMQLITVQRRLQALELALRQKIDFTSLVQEIKDQVSVLTEEADAAGEEELAGVIGQVSAYFDTVSEGRLQLNAAGLAIIRDFVLIFKDAIGDAAPGVSPFDKEQLTAWNARYQALMARMEPVYGEIAPKPEPAESTQEVPVTEQAPDTEEALVTEKAPVAEEALTAGYSSAELRQENISREEKAAPVDEVAEDPLDTPPMEIGNQKESFVEFRAAEDFPPPADKEDIPSYDPSAHRGDRDVVISDTEIKSVREYMKGAETQPEFVTPEMEEPERAGTIPELPVVDRKPVESYQSRVQLEEIQLLKKKITDLHEKQEKLSSKVTGMMGDIKAAMSQSTGRESSSVEDLTVDELEDIIFIGRKKG